MSPTDDPVFPISALLVRPWHDPVIDALGHDPRSAYVEHFWLPVLGPSATWLLRRLAMGLDRDPDGFDLDLVDAARSLGLGMRGGRHAPFLRSIQRCCQFGAARLFGDTTLEVRRRLPPLNRSQVARLTEPLQQAHQRWQDEQLKQAHDPLLPRATRLAASLLELGEDETAAEAQLERWRFEPETAREAVRNALASLPVRRAELAASPPPLDAA